MELLAAVFEIQLALGQRALHKAGSEKEKKMSLEVQQQKKESKVLRNVLNEVEQNEKDLKESLFRVQESKTLDSLSEEYVQCQVKTQVIKVKNLKCKLKTEEKRIAKQNVVIQKFNDRRERV